MLTLRDTNSNIAKEVKKVSKEAENLYIKLSSDPEWLEDVDKNNLLGSSQCNSKLSKGTFKIIMVRKTH